MKGIRQRYGASPLHLLLVLCSFVLTVYAGIRLLKGDTLGVVMWFIGAALLHDLVFLPLYTVTDRAVQGVFRHRKPTSRSRRPAGWINYVRFPAFVALLLLLVCYPLILNRVPGFTAYTALSADVFWGRWLLIAAALFAASALCLLVAIWRGRSPRHPPLDRHPPLTRLSGHRGPRGTTAPFYARHLCLRLRCRQRANFSMAAGVTGVKKLTRLPSGSRNSSDRLPQGIVVGSLTKSSTKPVRFWCTRSTSSTRNSMMTLRLSAGRAAPGREQRDGAGAADREGGRGGPELGEVLVGPGRLHAGGALVEVDEAGDVAGDDADRDEVHGALLGRAVLPAAPHARTRYRTESARYLRETCGHGPTHRPRADPAGAAAVRRHPDRGRTRRPARRRRAHRAAVRRTT